MIDTSQRSTFSSIPSVRIGNLGFSRSAFDDWSLVNAIALACFVAMSFQTVLVAQQTAAHSFDESARPPDEKLIPVGFLFVDGKYLPPPYVVRTTDIDIQIVSQGEVACSVSPNRNGNGRRDSQRDDRGDRQWSRLARNLDYALETSKTMVVFKGEQPSIIDRFDAGFMFEWLLKDPRKQLTSDPLPMWISVQDSLEKWNEKFASFVASTEFRDRAKQEIAVSRTNYDEEKKIIDAKRLLSRSQYPLSVAAMLLIAVAAGKLLGSHHVINAESTNEDPVADWAVAWLLLLAIAFSVLDLVWTLLAARAGEMIELNPLGNKFISNPTVLSIVKAISILFAAGVLYMLRKKLLARRACWWVCLICMLVVIRWVVLSGILA